MPQPEIQTLTTVSKSSPVIRTRTLIVGDFSKVPKGILKKVLAANIKMKQLAVDFWGCIRDSEEGLIVPIPEESRQEEVIGIFSTNATIVRFFGQQIGIYSTKGRELTSD
ncbi:MAG: hypothetical protein ACFE95_03415 [Candidatus Hodarchaeota archaeon]